MRPSSLHLAVALALAFPGAAMARGGGSPFVAIGAIWLFCVVLVWFYKVTSLLAVTFGFLVVGIWGMAHFKDTQSIVGSALMAAVGAAIILAAPFHREKP